MAGQWLHLAVTAAWDVVVPLASVARVLHRDDPEFGLWAEGALSLASHLGVGGEAAGPGVVVLLSGGSRWIVGDARMDAGSADRYQPVPPWLFERQPPWCRGVLMRADGWSFVADPAAVESPCG